MNSQNNNHWHYDVLAYNKRDKKNKTFDDFCNISLLAYSEEEAINKAKPVVNKKYYRIAKVFECVEIHGMQSEIQMAQLEIQKKTLDAMKGFHG